jgi:hypothetical protein
MTSKEFIQDVCKTLGDDFLFTDRIWQEDLFEIQDTLAKKIAEAANKGVKEAQYMVKAWPEAFQVS